MVSILRLPMSMTYDSYSGPDTGAAAYRGHADGGHVESYGTLRSNHVTDVTKHGRTSTVNLLQSDQNFSEHNVGENSTVNIVLFYTGHSYPQILSLLHTILKSWPQMRWITVENGRYDEVLLQ